MPAVTRSIVIKARPSEVWRWMASERGLREWVSPSLEIDLEVGGSYSLVGPDGESRVTGTVLEIVPEGSIVLSWFEEESDWLHPARLALSLRATAEGTEVTLVHDGFAGIGRAGWRSTLEAYERGADRHQILEKLAGLIDVDV